MKAGRVRSTINTDEEGMMGDDGRREKNSKDGEEEKKRPR